VVSIEVTSIKEGSTPLILPKSWEPLYLKMAISSSVWESASTLSKDSIRLISSWLGTNDLPLTISTFMSGLKLLNSPDKRSSKPLNTDKTNTSAAVPIDKPKMDIYEIMFIALVDFLLKRYRFAICIGRDKTNYTLNFTMRSNSFTRFLISDFFNFFNRLILKSSTQNEAITDP